VNMYPMTVREVNAGIQVTLAPRDKASAFTYADNSTMIRYTIPLRDTSGLTVGDNLNIQFNDDGDRPFDARDDLAGRRGMERDPNGQILADVAQWVADRLGQACYDEADDLPAGLSWESSGPVATIIMESGARLNVTAAWADADA
jgi:hypothetical protein